MREILRQLIHLFFGFILLFFAVTLNESLFLIFSFLLLLTTIIFSFYLKKKKQGFFLEIIKRVERENEKEFPGFGAIMFFTGFFLIALLDFFFLQKHLIVFSLIPLIVGDAFSTIIGNKIGRIKLTKNKSLEGSIAFIISSFLVLILIFPDKLMLALIASFLGSIIELLPINDNLSIPVILALSLSALKKLNLI